METKVKWVVILVLATSLAVGCGANNTTPSYRASFNSTVVAPDDISFESGGGAFVEKMIFTVLDNNTGEPINDMELRFLLTPHGDTSYWSDFYGEYAWWSMSGFIREESGYTIAVTNLHGAVDVDLYVPIYFSGTVTVSANNGTTGVSSTISVAPKGGMCFNGTDDEVSPFTADKLIDRNDPECVSGGGPLAGATEN